MVLKCCVLVCIVGLACGAPQEFWKGTALDSTVEKLKSSCDDNNNFACFQFKAFSFLDNVLRGGYLKDFTDKIKISRNGFENEIESKRLSDSLEDAVETFIKSNDVTFKVPIVGDLTVDSRKLDDNELNFKLSFGSQVEERGKKHKLKKIFIPLLTFVVLKAITVVPFLIGLLALKAWNGLQLSLFSFIIATGLAIFQLCQKLAADSHAPVILDHPPAGPHKSFSIVSVIATAVFLFYVLFATKKLRFIIFSRNYNAFYLPVLPFIGSMYFLAKHNDNVVQSIDFMGRTFGFPFSLWHGHHYHYCIKDPIEARAILHNLSAQNKGASYNDIAYVFKNSLLTIPYERWRVRRKQYAKCFKPQSLKPFSNIYYKGSTDLVKNIEAQKDKSISYDFFTKYAFSNFFYTSSGLEKEPKGMHRLGECLMEFQEDVAKKILDPLTPPSIWMKFYPGGKNTEKNMKEIRTINDEIIADKTYQRSDFKAFVENESAPPLLDLMMSIKGSILNHDDISDDLVFFSAAAADTSGHTLMIGFTLLGMHLDIQEKLYQEVMTTVGHDSILIDDLPLLVYTEAVIYEILRLFPVIPIITRLLDKDIDIGTKIIPKGANVMVSIFHLQRDEKYWPDPLKFDPTRFLPENASKITPHTYLAFSTGPRDCLGKGQAMAMLKISLASVVRNFKITSNHKSVDELKVMSSLTLKTKHELDCHFQPRQSE